MRIIRKNRYLLAAIAILLSGLPIFGQTDSKRKVTLTGTVVSVEPWHCWDEKEKCEFHVNLLLQFRNNTNSPVIIFKPFGIGETKISFFKDFSAQDASVSTPPSIKDTNPKYDPFPWFVRRLLEPKPDRSFTIIDPDGYHEWNQPFLISSGFKLKREPDPNKKNCKGCYIFSAIPKYPAFKIEYSLSVRNRPEDPNALEKAKENWKEFGNLILDSGGDYHIESEIILNKLP